VSDQPEEPLADPPGRWRPPEPVGVDGRNAAWAERDPGIGYSGARERADAAHAALRAQVEAIPADRWRRSLGRLVLASTSHHHGENMAWHAGSA
jgi:hypothetical protein